MIGATSVEAWLARFARCVRERDVEGARALFAADARAFGTRLEYAADREALMAGQWAVVWRQTHGFRFLDDPRVLQSSDDGSLVCVLALWESSGAASDGRAVSRRGRCTVVLRRSPESPVHCVAVHTHHSESPDGGL